MDKDSLVPFAAADSLIALEDPTGYEMYFEELTGEQKIQEGLIAEKKRMIADSRERNLLVLGSAAGFAPYAGYG